MKKKVMVAMSGGIDSSAAVVILKKQGYEVVGATMKLWGDGCPTDYACGSPEDLMDAYETADALGIKLIGIDLSVEFRDLVCGYFIKAYTEGATPNPCCRCNSYLKFGAFWDAAMELSGGFDYFATGHYALCGFSEETGRYFLKKAIEDRKDQSYFLAFLSQERLSKTIFPLGAYRKDDVRRLLKDENIPIFSKKESQDFKAARLLEDTPSQCGDVVDMSGNIIGRHKGIIHYTIGQRKGLGIASEKPMYVIDKNPKTNRIVLGDELYLMKNRVLVGNINFVSKVYSDWSNFKGLAKIRSTQQASPCSVNPIKDKFEIIFDIPQKAPAKGQAAVVYDGDEVLFGGIIE